MVDVLTFYARNLPILSRIFRFVSSTFARGSITLFVSFFFVVDTLSCSLLLLVAFFRPLAFCIAIATACFFGLPALTNSETLALITVLDFPLLKGTSMPPIMFAIKHGAPRSTCKIWRSVPNTRVFGGFQTLRI